jgi:hypothetical protein
MSPRSSGENQRDQGASGPCYRLLGRQCLQTQVHGHLWVQDPANDIRSQFLEIETQVIPFLLSNIFLKPYLIRRNFW